MRWPRTLRYRRTYRALTYVGILAALLGLMWLIMRPGAGWLAGDRKGMTSKEKADVLNGARQTLIQAVGVVGVIISAAGYFLSRRGQLTARFNGCASALCSPQMDERIGATHQLREIMREAPEMHNAVVALLAAFVRNHASLVPDQEPPARPPDDVLAALVALAERPPHRGETERLNLSYTQLSGLELRGEARLARVNLTGTQLRRAELVRADLSDAILDDADLTEAKMNGARLSGASLRKTVLVRTQLQEAALDGAQMIKVQLKEANLVRAKITDGWLVESDLTGAELARADLAQTSLSQSDLRHANGLSRAQVLSAVPHSASLPNRLQGDPQIDEHARALPRNPPPRKA